MSFLEIKNISKQFGGVYALKEISFEVGQGEIHAVCGENGAGKSTLIKTLSGVYSSGNYEGNFSIDGNKIHFNNIHEAEAAGVAVIHQELSLVKSMTVAENIFLGNEPSRFGIIQQHQIHSTTKKLLEQVGLTISPEIEVSELGIGEQQLVEIAKALNKKARLLILDEPTTSLTETETEKLFGLLRQLQSSGVTVIYISHRLKEIKTLCNRVTVLRDGKFITTRAVADISEMELIKLMVGREITDLYPKSATGLITEQGDGAPVLTLKNYSLFDSSGKKKIDSVNLEVHGGEILGIAGLMGSGRTELLMGIIGAWKGKQKGEILFNNKKVKFNSPAEAIANGIALVSEDRKRLGLILPQSIRFNLNLSTMKNISNAGILSGGKEMKHTLEMIQQLSVKTNSSETEVQQLSGGNQQKVVIGKCLLVNPKLLLLDEPTRGIDVGARAEIYELMNQLLHQGMAIIMVSSDLPEVIGMSNRIVVMNEGKISGAFSSGITQEEIMMAATRELIDVQ
ncbi:MAG: sugar ABC transporter ATP-binding protein [Bacteroidota bacterium]